MATASMWSLALLLALLGTPASLMAAQATSAPGAGVIEGRVTDPSSGNPLPGARVAVVGSANETSTERDGLYRLSGVAAGSRTVVVSYLGRADRVIETVVASGAVRHLDVEMGVAGFEETVTVEAGLLRDAEERAINRQKTAPNIMNVVSADRIGSFPDRNAAETTQRIPGISITKDQGEGRYVNIRGTEPRLNSMMIDGQRIPSPDPLIRQVALDVIPSDLLQSIEVSKALTPEMDGDAIGGAVNLVMKQAPERFRLVGSAGGGYNQMLDTFDQSHYSLTTGRRFDGGNTGVILSGSGSETNRGNQDTEIVYTPALGLNELNPRWYQVHRRRVGFTGAVDRKQGADAGVTLRGVFNRFIDDHENRQRVRWAVGNRRIDRELRDRTHVERIASLGITGHRLVGGSTTLDFQILGAYSDQFDPLTMTTTFRHANIVFAPNVSAASIDPGNVQANPQNEVLDNYNFQQQIRAVNFAKDRDLVAGANLRLPITLSAGSTSFLKVGAKIRNKRKGRTRNENTIASSSTLKMAGFLDGGLDLRPYLDGQYDLRPYLDQGLVESIPDRFPVTITRNHARDAEEFDGTENVAAGYAMAEIYAGPKLFILPGLRYEHTSADFVGRGVRFAPSGAWLGTDPLATAASYGVALPGLHVKYAATPAANLRVAVTRTLARPNYYDTVPYRAQDDNAATVSLGNPALRPTTSWNVDAMGEYYLKSVGVLSAGVFYKRLADYIYSFTLQQSIGATQYQVTQPLNGDAATVRGVEVALQNQLRFLPAPFDGIGVYANYTLSDSQATFPQHTGTSRLPGQSRHLGNVAASYERSGFTGRVSMTFHGSFVDVIGADNTQDRFYDTNSQVDVSVTQRLTRNLRIYADGLNLNDSLLRYYQGVSSRPLQEEHYHWSMNAGAKVEF